LADPQYGPELPMEKRGAMSPAIHADMIESYQGSP
jgi:hypothetical protein